jgi:hypothetical protein
MSQKDDEVKNLPVVSSPRLDGLSGFEGDDEASGRGPPIKFTNEAEWLYNEEELPANLELLVVKAERVVVYWDGDKPDLDKTRTLGPKEPWPDITALNAEVPREDWREGPDGNMHGPYQRQYVVHFLNLKTMDKYWWPTSTVGGGICVRDIVERTKWMRAYHRRMDIYPVVQLADVFMPTRFGGRQRPHLKVIRWITFGGGGGGGEALPAPDTLKQIDPPSAKEATGDSIPF